MADQTLAMQRQEAAREGWEENHAGVKEWLQHIAAAAAKLDIDRYFK